MAKVLIIDDDEFVRKSLSRCLGDMGHAVELAGDLAQGMARAREGADVIYLDIGLPDGDGHTIINELANTASHPEIIVLTGLRDNYGAQETMENGAWDYIQKPATPASIRASLESALSYRSERLASAAPKADFHAGAIIGSHPSMLRARDAMAKAAESEANVLVLGETGVGKELAAQAIHANSSRRDKPFVVVDCSNLTESLLESVLYGHAKGAFTGASSSHKGLVAEADGGTLFLDEVGELPSSLQKSFLRVLQEHRYRPVGSGKELGSDFRLIAATNRDLAAMTAAGGFRSDLLFRLHTVEVMLPPLRVRGSDILELASHFIDKTCARYAQGRKRMSAQLSTLLGEYTWPGNVRELGNAVEAAVIASGQAKVIYPKHLPSHIRMALLDKGKARRAQASTPQASAAPTPSLLYNDYKLLRDRAYFQHLMEVCDHDVTRASRLSGLSVPSIYRHLGLAGIATRSRNRG